MNDPFHEGEAGSSFASPSRKPEVCGCDESKQLREAIRLYFENNDDSALKTAYGYRDTKLVRATKALKEAMLRSHLGETVSYEEMAAAVLKAAKED